MTTVAPANLRGLAQDIENIPDLPSAVNSGIVGDKAHLAGGGYHLSYEDNVPGNYSRVRVNDIPPLMTDRQAAAAIDTSLNLADQVRLWYRVETVWKNRANDPRAKYFNAFNGWNGKGSAERLDFVSGARTVTDNSHAWHSHDETPRRYVNDPEARRAKLSVYRGESIVQYLTGGGGSSNQSTGGEMGNQLIVKDNTGKYWLCDGLFRKFIGTTAADVIGQGNNQSHQANLLGNLGNGGNPVDFGTSPAAMNGWGIDIATLGGLTPDVVAQIVSGVSAAVIAADTNELTAADLENVRAAAQAGAEEAISGLEIKATIGVGHTVPEA